MQPATTTPYNDLPLFSRNAAYRSITEELGTRQREVLDIIRSFGKISNAGIARALRLGINQVTPRVHELRKKNMVEVAGSETDPMTGRTVTVWRET